MLTYVSQSKGPHELAEAVHKAEADLGVDARGTPAALPERPAQGGARRGPPARRGRPGRAVADHHGEAVRHRPRVRGRAQRASCTRSSTRSQIFRIDHFLGKEAAQNILAFRFANGLFEPIWNRNFIQHVQIDVPETLGLEGRTAFYEGTGAYRDMVVTHLMQVLAFMAMEPPTSLAPGADQRREAQGVPLDEDDRAARRGPRPVQRLPRQGGGRGVLRHRDLHRAASIEIDNWRWAGVPFFLRTGKKLAEGARVISIAFKEPPLSMFPAGSNAGMQGPDHLTFDLADQSRMSLSLLRQAARPGHAAGEAVDAVRDPRHRVVQSTCSRPTSG